MGRGPLRLASITGAGVLLVALFWALPRPDRLSRAALAAPATASQAGEKSSARQGAAASRPAETAAWKTLENTHGWSVRYPPSWQVTAVGADAGRPEDAFQPVLTGPKGCYERGEECGYIQLGSGWHPLTRRQAAVSVKDALLQQVGDSRFVLLQHGDTTLGGRPACFIVYRMKLYSGYPNGVIFKEVATRYRNYFYFIMINEEGKDRAAISAINSPDAWALKHVFDEIISSFKFTSK